MSSKGTCPRKAVGMAPELPHVSCRSTTRTLEGEMITAVSETRYPTPGPRDLLAVECAGITKTFGDGDTKIQVLRGIDLEVRLGEMTLLVGPSGCGKTTLISIIAGLLNPTDGDVRVLGESLVQMGGRRRTA